MPRVLALAVLVLGLAAGGASAQVETGAYVGPDSLRFSGPALKRPPASPLHLALSLAFETTTWAAVGVSTATPAADIEAFLGRGFYKLELIQLVLMARHSGQLLSKLAMQREKGQALRLIAEGLPLDYDALYETSLALSRRVDERIESLMRVAPLPSGASP